MKVEIIPCLSDNFSYLIHDKESNKVSIVDPAEYKACDNVIKKYQKLDFILNTHHHGDHIGGNNILKSKFDAKIIAFEDDKDRIPMIDIPLKDNQIWKDGIFEFKVIHVPGHTSGHICFHFFHEKTVFTGDTLFSLGCGRIFEGSYEDMFNSLSRLKVLPPETNIYFGHEYTLNNAIFCQRFDQNNSELNKKILNIKKKLDSGFPSVPSTIKDELNCNIFLRAKNQQEFSKLRDLKDNF